MFLVLFQGKWCGRAYLLHMQQMMILLGYFYSPLLHMLQVQLVQVEQLEQLEQLEHLITPAPVHAQ